MKELTGRGSAKCSQCGIATQRNAAVAEDEQLCARCEDEKLGRKSIIVTTGPQTTLDVDDVITAKAMTKALVTLGNDVLDGSISVQQVNAFCNVADRLIKLIELKERYRYK